MNKEKETKFVFQFINEWTQLKGNYNWYNWTIVDISFEKDVILPGFEVNFVLFGIGIFIRINGNWEETKAGRDIIKKVKELHNQ